MENLNLFSEAQGVPNELNLLSLPIIGEESEMNAQFKPEPPKEFESRISTAILGGFESTAQALVTSSGPKGYLVDASIKRGYGSPFTNQDRIYMAYWCSGKTNSWFSRDYNQYFNGSQTPWLPAGPNALSNNASVIWLPTPDYNSQTETVVHSLFLMRQHPNGDREIFVWEPSNGAPFPYTGTPSFPPANPSQDQQANGFRRVYRISPNNPRGFELWGRPKYRMPL